MTDLSVDPGGLRAVSAGIAGAADAFESANAAIHAASGTLQSSGALDQDRRADDKLHTFVRQFSSEFDLMREMLSGFRSLLEDAATAYEEQEVTIRSAFGEGT